MIKLHKSDAIAVSEVLGTIFLLGISVTVLSIVSATLLSVDVKTEPPAVHLVASVEGNYLVVEHRGGDSLDLETKILIDYNGNSRLSLRIDEESYLDDAYKSNGKWDIGEKFKFPLANLTDFTRFEPVDVMVVDKYSNSFVMNGKISEAKTADIKVNISTPNKNPQIGSTIPITITVSNDNGPSDGHNITVKYLLPGSLSYQNSNPSSGTTYDYETGIWDVGDLQVGTNKTLQVNAKVESYGYSLNFNQLVILLDGSGSIDSDSWELAKQGLAEALIDDVFPHDGTVEVTLVQFGDSKCAKPEIYPQVIYYSNYQTIANQILNMAQGEGYTPTAAGIYLGSDLAAGSSNFGGFNSNNRQIVLLVTDGNANVYSEQGVLCGSTVNEVLGRQAAENAREYMIDHLYMSKSQDEFDIIAVDDNVKEQWLKDMVWPQPSHSTWPPEGPGWYNYVDDWQDFKDSVKYYFEAIFRRIDSRVEIVGSSYMDPNSINNYQTISIYPKS